MSDQVSGKPPKPRTCKPLTPAELDKVAESAPEAYRVAVPVAAWCGLRFGELIELRRKDIHTRRRPDRLSRSEGPRQESGKAGGWGQPKTDAGIRDVTVPPHVASSYAST